MERLQAMFQGRQTIPMSGFLDFTPLSYPQKQYLTSVYGLLLGSVVTTALGVHFALTIMHIPLLVSTLVQFGCVMYIGSSRYTGECPSSVKDNRTLKRLSALLAFAFCLGTSISRLVDYANYISPAILPTAFFATFSAFACLSLAAMFSQERKFLFLGSILTSIMMYLSMVSLFNLFFGSSIAHDVVLYGGLIAYLGYVLYDTQAVIFEFTHRGIRDPVLHSFTFYLHVVGIFLRLMRIMIEREERRRATEETNDRKRRR